MQYVVVRVAGPLPSARLHIILATKNENLIAAQDLCDTTGQNVYGLKQTGGNLAAKIVQNVIKGDKT
jgi:hypothetical protein